MFELSWKNSGGCGKGTALFSTEEYMQMAALFHINGHWLAGELYKIDLIR